MIKVINIIKDPEWWRTLLGSDFNKGFMAALCLILLLILFLLIVRGIFSFIFRKHRCGCIEINRADGCTKVDREVIASVVERELAAYPSLRPEKIQLTRRGKHYQLTVYCNYLLSDQSGIPAFCDEFKPRLKAALEKSFGITTLEEVCFWITGQDETEGADNSGEKADDAYIGL